MSVKYSAVLWNRQKRIYDRVMWGLMLLYLILFAIFQFVFQPDSSIETLIIRATASLALIMLHIILMIGPLCRIADRFLPLLYNRRHMGVSMFLMALVHGIFGIIQFHTLGDTNPLTSIFIANPHYSSLVNFPFQSLGFFALIILFLMAATSHDFWLHNLSPKVWKILHMFVYVAYGLVVMHVMLGIVQAEPSPILVGLMGLGLVTIIGLHLTAAFLERSREAKPDKQDQNGFVAVCEVDEIQDNCAKVVIIGTENIAIFKYDGKLSAINNVCKHQNGPLGEGKIVDGCITCPWHGYQYLPENGQSPPPFTEKVSTYDVRLEGTTVLVNPNPHPEGTKRPAVVI